MGVGLSEDDLLTTGRRIVVLERMFNLREDPQRVDTLPWRLMNEPISEGPYKGEVNSASELNEMLDRYYRLQGFDPKSGRPTRDVLSSLNLLDNVNGLEHMLSDIK